MQRSKKNAQNNTLQWKARGFKSSSDAVKKDGDPENNTDQPPRNQPPNIYTVPAGFKNIGAKLLKKERGDTTCESLSPTSISRNDDSPQSSKKTRHNSVPVSPDKSKAKSKSKPTSSKKPSPKKITNPNQSKGNDLDGQGDPKEDTAAVATPKRKKQKFQGYTLFIGNLSYDTTKEDILNHFSKCGTIKNVRIPLDKATNQSRGFGYIEVEEHVTYEKLLSLHHSFLKKRRINVECTFGGSKTSQKRKALIKEKTLKLRFLSREGKISSAKQRPWGKFTMTKSSDT